MIWQWKLVTLQRNSKRRELRCNFNILIAMHKALKKMQERTAKKKSATFSLIVLLKLRGYTSLFAGQHCLLKLLINWTKPVICLICSHLLRKLIWSFVWRMDTQFSWCSTASMKTSPYLLFSSAHSMPHSTRLVVGVAAKRYRVNSPLYRYRYTCRFIQIISLT